METIYLSLVHTGSLGYLIHEIPSRILYIYESTAHNGVKGLNCTPIAVNVHINYFTVIEQYCTVYTYSYVLFF